MPKKESAVLDFGSKNISVLIGKADVNGSLVVKGFYSTPYEGFMDGEFLESKNVPKVVEKAIRGCEKMCDCKITSLTIGVPTEFCYCVTKKVAKNFLKPKKISSKDVQTIFKEGVDSSKTHTLINESCVCYVVGENTKVASPIGLTESKLSACLSIIYADNKFMGVVSSSLAKLGIMDFNFVSSAYAQGMYLFDETARDNYTLMVDCGYITTTVALFRGNGVLNLSSFSMGGGHISADLSECLKIPFQTAEDLLRKIVLCISPRDNDTYEVMLEDSIKPVNMRVANEIVRSRIEVIAQCIAKCFNAWKFNFPDFIPVNLTGGGLSFLKGGKDELAKFLGKNVEIVKMPYSRFTKTNYSSCMAVLNYRLNIMKQQ